MIMRQAYESFRGGTVSYTKFQELVRNHDISRVIVNQDNTADFRVLNLQTGLQGSGKVYLAPDPNFFQMLQENGVDLTINLPDETLQKFMPLLGNVGIAVFILLIIFIFGRRQGGVGFGGGMDPFNMGKSKAKVQMEP